MEPQHELSPANDTGPSLTESVSEHRHLDRMSLAEILERMNGEDQKVPLAVAAALPQVHALAEAVLRGMKAGGRLFYLGAGTSGRLGVVDASECPPTFGVDFDRVVALIAGGDGAIRKAVEFAEDDWEAGWQDLAPYEPGPLDTVVGLAASGRTPYVLGALKACQQRGIPTGCVTCNPGAALLACSDYPVVVAVGPEFLTGSTRLKSGTAQKLVLNMLTTSVMIGLGLVEDNKMTHLRPSNYKLQERARRMIMEATGLVAEQADEYLRKYGQVHRAVEAFRQKENGTQNE
ncbi:MAG: N-acetylmuramic acid 6-phosphate etherase [Cytophagia bacterium]|nr:N-acetylmuramic acid 6-phosphate etherase [Cytophagia bacterium]